MKVIFAGLGKTGTKSIAKALRILGYTVYDGVEHFHNHVDDWLSIYGLGKSPDFASMYRDVDAITDLPASFWFEEIFESFPDAKVVLNLRDNDEVYAQSLSKHMESMHDHRDGFLKNMLMKLMKRFSGHWKFFTLAHLVDTAAYGSLKPESIVLFKKKYREHNQRVQFVIPKEKLLIYNVKQGWKPLCEFLGCDVPEEAFPRENVGQALARTLFSKWRDEFTIKIILYLAAFFFILIVCYFTINALVM